MVLMRIAALALAVFLVTPCVAQTPITPEMQTGWIELVRGHVDAETGAEVHGLAIDPETGHHDLTIAIPRSSVADQRVIEEVRVIGQAPERVELELPEIETRWIEDYDSDYYGLLLRFKEGPETPIRLFFSTRGGVLDNAVQP